MQTSPVKFVLLLGCLALRSGAEELRIASTIDGSLCVAIPGGKPWIGISVILNSCTSMDSSQIWIFDVIYKRIMPKADQSFCLTAYGSGGDQKGEGPNFSGVFLEKCTGAGVQSWTWENQGAISIQNGQRLHAFAGTDHAQREYIYMWDTGCLGHPECVWELREPVAHAGVRKPVFHPEEELQVKV